MKFILLLAVLGLSAAYCKGQNTTPNYWFTGPVAVGASTTPTSMFHVYNAEGSGITMSYSSANNYRAQIVPYWNSGADTRIDFNINNHSGDTPSTIMSIGYNSNVGIGTTTPASRLHLGSAAGSGLTMGYDGTDAYRMQIIPYWNSSDDTRIDFNINHNRDVTPETLMSVGYKQNVGIGTKTPDEKLTVKGGIHAEKVTVDLSVPAPDYVFAADYDLMPLKDVETYVNSNNHLPGIPAAAEFARDGVDLGKTDMKLLQKVEELTLYLIRQQKQLEEQAVAIVALKKENAAIKTQLVNSSGHRR